MTRGDLCIAWWNSIKDLPDLPFERKSGTDADGDGIPDIDDALLFTPNEPIRFAIDVPKLTPETDGIPPKATSQQTRTFNFCGGRVKSPKGFEADNGQVFDEQRGYGWTRDLTANNRRRNAVKEVERDAFVFTRQEDTWECALDRGSYQVTVCVGDSGHEQLSQRVTIEGKRVVNDATTARGQFAEAVVVVDVTDGRLTVELGSGKPGSNTCINWLRIEPSN